MRFNYRRAVERELQESLDLTEQAEAIAEQARAIAPVDTGAYRDSIKVEDGKIVADVDHAAAVEFGTLKTPTYAPLRRAAEQVAGSNALKAGRSQ